MVKYIFSILCMMSFLNSCGQKLYKIEKDQYGEPLLSDKVNYSFTKKPTREDLNKIDVNAYYIQVFEGGYYNENERRNPKIIIFHNDGFFKNESLLYFGKFDEHREKNSVAYGGKYEINGNEVLIERFLFASEIAKKYVRTITIGKIEGDKIIFKDKNSVTIFEKRKELPKIEK